MRCGLFYEWQSRLDQDANQVRVRPKASLSIRRAKNRRKKDSRLLGELYEGSISYDLRLALGGYRDWTLSEVGRHSFEPR